MNNNNGEPFSAIEYFSGKTVFLTGATGLLGKQIVEKLLHCTQIAKIYILMRPKRNKSIIDREKEYVQSQLFKFRLSDSVLSKLSVIAGDIGNEGLGISIADRQKLVCECQVIIHSAATVRFNEPLSVAMNLNVKGTQRMLDLAVEAQQLESFVYVSTAFTHCFDGKLDEEVCIPTVDPHEVLRLMAEQDTKTFDTETASLVMGPHPNTYTLTKSLSDHLVVERAVRRKLPVAIAKPAIITGPMHEPFPGFCDELTQAIPAVGIGIGSGITRVIPGHPDNHLPIIPVDIVANSVIMIAAKTAGDAGSESVSSRSRHACDPDTVPRAYGIFNTSKNIVTQGTAFTACYDISSRQPLLKALRPPAVVAMIQSMTTYKILSFFYEILFALLIDLLFRLSGQKAVIGRIVTKARSNITLLSFFLLCDWEVSGVNNRKVFESLTPEEKKVFAIDSVEGIDWKAYIEQYYLGVRRFYFGEFGGETTAKATRRLNRISVAYNLMLLLLFMTAALTGYHLISFII